MHTEVFLTIMNVISAQLRPKTTRFQDAELSYFMAAQPIISLADTILFAMCR